MTDFKKEWNNAKTDLQKRAVIEQVLNTYCTNESAVYFDNLVDILQRIKQPDWW
jgi:hypothetical protein